MATSTARAPSRGIISPLAQFCRRRFCELAGLGLICLALFTLISLLSFDVSDPSLNKTGDDAIRNAAGLTGAYLADLLLQTTGLASIFFIAALCGWSWRFISKRARRGWWLRITSLLILLTSAAGLFASFGSWDSWPIAAGLGGSIGMLVKQALASILTLWGAIPVLIMVSALALPLAIGLNRKEWVSLLIIGQRLGIYMASFWRFVRNAMRGEADEMELHSAPAPTRKARVKDKPEAKLHLRRITIPKMESAEEDEKPAKAKPVAPAQASFELTEREEGDYELPPVDLLNKVSSKSKKKKVSDTALVQNAQLLESTLQDFGVKGDITCVRPGPVVTLYELEPAAGTKSSRVIGLADDIARSMSAISSRIAVIPGKNALGIEMPNSTRETVYLREMIEHDSYDEQNASLPLILGKDISGEPVIADLARMPHLLVAGTTGSGKSVAINTMIMSLMYKLTPDQCKFIMIDPKMLELSVYDGIPHLLAPVVTEPGKAVVALKWTVKEMENRYRLMSNLGVRNIDNYNKRIKEAAKRGEELFRTVQTGFSPETGKPIMEKQALEMVPLPFIVVVVDEMADLMLVAGKDIETSVQRLAQMARAAGIHIIMATQRPSVDVITGVIKANFPTRISFQVTSKIDSRTILGEQGAEQLLGQGDMLYMAGGGRIQRVHGPFISDREVEHIVSFLKTQGEPSYLEEVTLEEEEEEGGFGMEDESDSEKALYDQAVQIVLRDQKASTSYIQRKLKIGYNRAARIIEQMEEDGVVGSANHVGKREVLRRAG